MSDTPPDTAARWCAACKGTGENRGARCGICNGTGSVPDTATLVRWWVDLNRWIWPDDLPGKPDPKYVNERDAIRGAHTVVDALLKDDPKAQQAIDKAWRKVCNVA